MRVFHDLQPALGCCAHEQAITAIRETVEMQTAREQDPDNQCKDTPHQGRKHSACPIPDKPCDRADHEPDERIPDRGAPAIARRPVRWEPDGKSRHQTERNA